MDRIIHQPVARSGRIVRADERRSRMFWRRMLVRVRVSTRRSANKQVAAKARAWSSESWTRNTSASAAYSMDIRDSSCTI
eukprot:scaffold96561_cov24-Prasinocladus_malaysianus.AAC.1